MGPKPGPELVEENEVTAADRPRLSFLAWLPSFWCVFWRRMLARLSYFWLDCRVFPLRLLARLFSHDFAAIHLASLVFHGLAAFFLTRLSNFRCAAVFS